LHGPTAIGQCTICHNPHSSEEKGLLTEPHSQLCFSCHETTRDELTEFPFVHEPVKDNCIGCHDSHGADNPMMLKADTPQLCFPCHENIQKIAESSAHPHVPVTETDGCLKCHTPHASTAPFGLKADPMTLCLTCHSEPIPRGTGDVLKAFTDEIDGKEFLHGPVAQRECSGCHGVHGSDHFRLLVKAYPSTFYASFKKENYDLCFSCHEESLVMTQRTASLTGFRNGDRNLHFTHVNKERRGRTCRSCHETHASRYPKHIRSSVPYGRWELPIKFTITETGGHCQTGCHRPYGYDREVPIENITGKKTAKK
jgi:predicted CXXCH cytochrome family protein